jgi:hypothetical protein
MHQAIEKAGVIVHATIHVTGAVNFTIHAIETSIHVTGAGMADTTIRAVATFN